MPYSCKTNKNARAPTCACIYYVWCVWNPFSGFDDIILSNVRSFLAWGRNSKGRYRVRGEILVSCSLCSHFSMYRLPKHSAPNRRNICFRCFRIFVLLRFPSHFPLLYLAPFHRATSGRTPREEHDNSQPSKSADY